MVTTRARTTELNTFIRLITTAKAHEIKNLWPRAVYTDVKHGEEGLQAWEKDEPRVILQTTKRRDPRIIPINFLNKKCL
ncbi:hypothetical protein DXF93_03800 [Escherichia coli]|nr:hypothetical protein C2U51_09635 [Enterobacteriaceae bacterium ENNIH1]RDT56273.1 hypothetical protein DXF93_03800 [Escherichia coli]